ncbi:hydroperoxide isomerase ALOXE3-like isoform X2 [Convolutriloba macropyga]|uniref:hydroperoxide isomerase ALOXE3-like isoform X2 n=1 Tax=Convolutriloba macropyga TaxID=536237 RepID=UPI003F5279FD
MCSKCTQEIKKRPKKAGTSCNVFIQVVGENKNSNWLGLDSKGNDFEAGKVGYYPKMLPSNLGKLKKLYLNLKGPCGFAPDWYLEKIVVDYNDGNGKSKIEFPVDKWIKVGPIYELHSN